MKAFLLTIFLALTLSNLKASDIDLTGRWELHFSSITYTIKHTLKTAQGKSERAKGKVECAKTCNLVIGVPLRTFDSGDSNRDLHMLETTRGAAHPLVMVRANFLPSVLLNDTFSVPLDVEFAGKKGVFRTANFKIVKRFEIELMIQGVMMIQLSDFNIIPPAFLGMSVEDAVPITIDMVWKKKMP